MSPRRGPEGYGLSTAASMWVVGAAGIATGGGMWRTALTTTAIVLIVLIAGRRLDLALRKDRTSDGDD